MSESLRLLIVEDNPTDAALMVRELQRAGFTPVWRRVSSEPAFVAELVFLPDLILSDYAMPEFDGLRALALLRERGLDVPFILISGTLGEEAAVEAMKQGATDYVLKDRLGRLVPAVRRAIQERRLREESRLLQESLRKAEARLKLAATASNLGLWDLNLETREVYFSPEWKLQLGYADAELPNRYEEWEHRLHPEDRERILARVTELRADPGSGFVVEFRLRHRDGNYRWIHTRGVLMKDESDRPCRLVGCHIDITEMRLLEEQVRQSQKMEAIGQLAGGVAHDFNNILGAMLMQADLASGTPDVPAEALELIEDLKQFIGRASHLTRQLLAFGRRQVMQAGPLDLNDAVTQLTRMLHRIVGEDVDLRLELAPHPCRVHADPGMIDQVLLNLVVNARDAMPDGGLLLVGTRELRVERGTAMPDPAMRPGRYCRFSVTDNGTGIAPEHVSRIFEPFFTTKEPGKGTGLGLATVFGIVKQHDGCVSVDTHRGVGTTFHVYLPALEAAPPPEAAGRPVVPVEGGTETILLVEDEPTVRTLTRALLERYGYRVLEAGDGIEAIRMWEQHATEIRLLLTDIVMPHGISGRELAVWLRERREGLPVIFTSGYTAEIAGRQLELLPGQNFLQKPAAPLDLLAAIRRSLDG